MKGLVIYCGNYGSTERYGNWIGSELNTDVKYYKKVNDADIQAADYIVMGSCVMAGKMVIAKWIADKEALLDGKPLFVYSTSGAKPGDKDLEGVFERSLPQSLIAKSKTYNFGGKMDFQNLSGLHKFLMNLGIMIQKDPEVKAQMKKDKLTVKDNIDRGYITPLLTDVKSALSA